MTEVYKPTITTTNTDSSQVAQEIPLLNQQATIIKDCNYKFLNTIKATEEVQQETDKLDVDAPLKGYDHLIRRINRLQHFVTLESEECVHIMSTLDKLDIVGHIKHSSRRHNKEKQKELERISQDPEQSKLIEEEKEKQEEMKQEIAKEDLHNSMVNIKPEDSDSDSSDSDSDSSDSDDEIRFGPHTLRKFRKALVSKLISLIEYQDKLANDLEVLKKKAIEKKQTLPNVPYDMSLKDSFDIQSPKLRNDWAKKQNLLNHSGNYYIHLHQQNHQHNHQHNQHQHSHQQPTTNNGFLSPPGGAPNGHVSPNSLSSSTSSTSSLTSSQSLSPVSSLARSIDRNPHSHERCCSPLFNNKFKDLKISSPDELFVEIDHLQSKEHDQDDDTSINYNVPDEKLPMNQLKKYLETVKSTSQ